MSIPEKMEISFKDKPNIQAALLENPALVKEVISTFVGLMEQSFDKTNGYSWAELPKLLNPKLDFASLVRGVLRGALDVKGMDAEAFAALGVEAHPFAMFSPRKSGDRVRVYDWRKHWHVDPSADVSEEVVADLVKKMFRYTRWIKLDEFADAVNSSQVVTYKALPQVIRDNLPFAPALLYQKKIHGSDLAVGKRIPETGFFDCGEWPGDATECPACKHPTEEMLNIGGVIGCLYCDAGFILEE